MRSFFVLSEREKETKKAQEQPTKRAKTRQEDNRIREDKRKSKEHKRRQRRGKIEANTLQAFNPPNHSRTQKPHKPRKAHKQHKPTRTP